MAKTGRKTQITQLVRAAGKTVRRHGKKQYRAAATRRASRGGFSIVPRDIKGVLVAGGGGAAYSVAKAAARKFLGDTFGTGYIGMGVGTLAVHLVGNFLGFGDDPVKGAMGAAGREAADMFDLVGMLGLAPSTSDYVMRDYMAAGGRGVMIPGTNRNLILGAGGAGGVGDIISHGRHHHHHAHAMHDAGGYRNHD